MFQVRVWESAFGSTYEQAVTAPEQNGRLSLAGESQVLREFTDRGGPPAALYGLNGIVLTVIPEPSTLALVILGVVFVLFRVRAVGLFT
jgi:hypothetical protein